jgi:hypothetical protein
MYNIVLFYLEPRSALPQEHSGQVHFGTDAWTSTNHRAFVAWTVHLHHEGSILVFLLDIIEVPEVRVFSTLIHGQF